MQRKSAKRIVFCSALSLALAGCLPGRPGLEPNADFYVAHAGQGQAGVPGYKPTGYGWTPNSTVEFSIWHEPDGPGSASSQWKKILDVHVDASGMFGFNAGAAFYPVRRSICGTPEQQQTMVFMAKNPATGTIRMRQSPVDLYFTFQPCP